MSEETLADIHRAAGARLTAESTDPSVLASTLAGNVVRTRKVRSDLGKPKPPRKPKPEAVPGCELGGLEQKIRDRVGALSTQIAALEIQRSTLQSLLP